MSDSPRRRALLVTPGRARGALAAVRALGQAGWTVGVGGPELDSMVAASRWVDRTHRVPRPRGHGSDFIDAVREAIRSGGYTVVFGGADDWVAALAAHRTTLPAFVAHPAQDIVATGLDKLELARRARAAGLPSPRTVLATDRALAGWEGPVVVKCRSHWAPGQQNPVRIEARRFTGTDAAAEHVGALRDAGLEAVLQAPVEGHLGALVGLMHDGRLLGRVQQCTAGLWPTPNGVSSRAHTVPVDRELAGRAEAMLADMGLTGLVELQFLAPLGESPRLIDLNPRFYGSLALALAAAGNLADAWGRQALGLPLPELPDGRPGVHYVWTAGDLRRAMAERRHGLGVDVLETLRWSVGADATSVWTARDPRPVLHLIGARLRRLVRRSEPAG